MPQDYRDNLRKTRDYCNNTVINIVHEMTVQGLGIKDVCSKSGIKETTLRKHFSEPEALRQYEIAAIAKVLGVSPFKLSGCRLMYEEGK